MGKDLIVFSGRLGQMIAQLLAAAPLAAVDITRRKGPQQQPAPVEPAGVVVELLTGTTQVRPSSFVIQALPMSGLWPNARQGFLL